MLPKVLDLGQADNRVRRLLADWLPVQCPLCAMPNPCGRARLCSWCESSLGGFAAARCPFCGLAHHGNDARCPYRQSRINAIDAVLVAADFTAPLTGLIHAFKYRGKTALAGPLAGVLSKQVQARQASPMWPHLLVPVPLTPARLHERGYNQALLLARRLHQFLGIPVSWQACQRTTESASQAALGSQVGRSRRARLAQQAFRYVASPQVAGKRIALIDDVMTTGATANAMAASLKAAGAVRVEAWVVARTPSPITR